MTNPLQVYLSTLEQDIKQGQATEHTHRPTLKALLESLAPEVKAINEPKRIACGAPDLAVLKSGLLVGHVEAKDVGVALDEVERSPQLKRYRDALENLVLTDYLEFRLYVKGERRAVARLAEPDKQGRLKATKGGAQAVAALLADFLSYAPQPITTPRELAERMARLTHLIREIVVRAFEQDAASDMLQDWRKAFAEVLVAELDQPEKLGEFADMFAQTLAYGLFSARVMDTTPSFTRQEAQALIPKTNPFLRKFFFYITGPDLEDEPYAGLVEDLVQLLAHTDMGAVLADFGKRTRQDDPVVHFYETFLTAYDPALREMRGVYYTPAPVVSFIVRSVDALLKSRFGLPAGLADTTKVTVKNTDPGLRVKGKAKEVRKTTEMHKVLVLDPATGTGTFLYAVVDLIRTQFLQAGNAGMWSGYVREHLLPRLFGFELLMAPYAVAHFKLAMQLAGQDLEPVQRAAWAYDFASDERIQIYLTNALEAPHEHTGLPLFTQFIADESAAADEVKQVLPIMVVLGNPPYSGHSANKGAWIDGLLKGQLPDGSKVRGYYEVDGHPLGERNPKWLQDDYVKFIRFGQWRITQTGAGILAFISNNGYLDNPTFRGMRQALRETFSEIYILDLHGSARKKEAAPDGTPDENVFDIMQGVAIALFVKEPGKRGPAKVYHADLWGRREEKYRRLWEMDADSAPWEALEPQAPFYLFVPQNVDLLMEYQQGHKATETFLVNVLGFQTHRDDFAIAFDRSEIERRIIVLREEQFSDAELEGRFGVADTPGWQMARVRRELRANPEWQKPIIQCMYRPFDLRWCYFSTVVMDRPRRELLDHVAGQNNSTLLLIRQMQDNISYSHILIANTPTIDRTFACSRGAASVFPLYLYPESKTARLFDAASAWPPDPAHGNRVPNLAPAFVKALESSLGLTFSPIQSAITPASEFGPEDILHYCYATLHSPTYRTRYAEFLKIDFPRVPLTADPALFWRLVALGRDLAAFHLLEHPQVSRFITRYPVPGNNQVDKGYPKYAAERVLINPTQYFEGVPESVWKFQVGGYQVLDKWLKDRRGRLLTFDDLAHYQKVVVALAETMRIMDEIDAVIPGWPLR